MPLEVARRRCFRKWHEGVQQGSDGRSGTEVGWILVLGSGLLCIQCSSPRSSGPLGAQNIIHLLPMLSLNCAGSSFGLALQAHGRAVFGSRTQLFGQIDQCRMSQHVASWVSHGLPYSMFLQQHCCAILMTSPHHLSSPSPRTFACLACHPQHPSVLFPPARGEHRSSTPWHSAEPPAP